MGLSGQYACAPGNANIINDITRLLPCLALVGGCKPDKCLGESSVFYESLYPLVYRKCV